jgi:hypothetical protein
MNNLQADFGPAIPQHGANRQYNATGASKAYVADDDVLQLTLQGVRVGMITTLSDPCGNLDKDVAISSNVSTGGQWSQIASTCSDEGIYRHTNESNWLTLGYVWLTTSQANSQLMIDAVGSGR